MELYTFNLKTSIWALFISQYVHSLRAPSSHLLNIVYFTLLFLLKEKKGWYSDGKCSNVRCFISLSLGVFFCARFVHCICSPIGWAATAMAMIMMHTRRHKWSLTLIFLKTFYFVPFFFNRHIQQQTDVYIAQQYRLFNRLYTIYIFRRGH